AMSAMWEAISIIFVHEIAPCGENNLAAWLDVGGESEMRAPSLFHSYGGYRLRFVPFYGNGSTKRPNRLHNPVHVDASPIGAPSVLTEIASAVRNDVEVWHGNLLSKAFGPQFVQKPFICRPVRGLCAIDPHFSRAMF